MAECSYFRIFVRQNPIHPSNTNMTPEERQQAIEKLETMLRTSQFEEAKKVATNLLQSHDVCSDSVSAAQIYTILGRICRNQSQFTEAIQYYERSVQLNEQMKNNHGVAMNLGNIGYAYSCLSDFPKAIEYQERALEMNTVLKSSIGIANNLGNIGIVYHSISDYPKALEYYQKTLALNEELHNKQGIAINVGLLGNVYIELGDYRKALEYYEEAIARNEEIGNKRGIAMNLGNSGNAYNFLSMYEEALQCYEQALKINEEIGSKEGIASNVANMGVVYKKQQNTTKALKYYEQALAIQRELGDNAGIAINLGNIARLYTDKADYTAAIDFLHQSYEIANEIGSKTIQKDCLEAFAKIYELQENFKEAFIHYKQHIQLKEEIQSDETKKKAELFDQQRKIEEAEKTRQLKLARFQEQEKLLHTILPVSIADRILMQETFIADHFDSVSVLFLDIVGFTSLSSIAPPKHIVYLLDTIFSKADEIIESFGLEKIKTIGDGYLAVANVSSPVIHHQKATAMAALALVELLQEYTVVIPKELGDSSWTHGMKDLEIRIGLHTGEVVAGIIGKNKFTYDLWGDAVNVASRMESNSEPWKVHISEKFAQTIEQVPEFNIIPRGEISIKGKGTMNTFWLEKAG